MRVGLGFDAHRFGGTGPLILGGLTFENEQGLSGHSDADVVVHALIDGLLGAAALGDIGRHFPPDDARWQDASSMEMLRIVTEMVAESGYTVSNVDITLVAERPKIAGRVEEMRRCIADTLRVPLGHVSIKGTTAEGMGALGRSEGIAALAVTLIERAGAE